MKKSVLFAFFAILGIAAAEYWIPNIEHGISSFHGQPGDYKVFRNVMDFGCRADGVTDDTACINEAISTGGRCGEGCGSSTITPGLIYFPPGRYLVSSPLIMYYYSQLVGDANDPPVLVAAPGFSGIGLIDTDPYGDWGNQWYTNQNNFFRQVRNFVIDLTQTPPEAETSGIHWQVAQATSLFKIRFIMTPGSNHQGILMENGSGGYMSDLTFEGGKYGMWVGNQQFLSVRMSFTGCDTAIYVRWNWQWTFKGLDINNCRIGIDMSATAEGFASGVGSILLLDSSLNDVETGVLLGTSAPATGTDTSDTLLLDNVRVNNVNNVVADINGASVLTSAGTIESWGRGSLYRDANSGQAFGQDNLPGFSKSANLLDGEGNFFYVSRPQYENLAAGDFASVKAGGAQGDGRTDDSDAIQAVLNANVNGKVVYFPAGTYIIGKTVTVPAGSRLIGEAWSILMADGAAFQDENNPQPMLRVGNPGDAGVVEITEFMFASKGPQPGAILVEWNIHESSQGSAGMWDSHFRVGGTEGSNLQANCPSGQGAVPECFGVHTLIQFTPTSSGFLENVWAWTADHDLDNQAQGQVSLYTGRGVLIQSTQGPVWLYGTQSEHNVLYQYQLDGASNVFMTMIQSETPYFQPGPPAPAPWTPNAAFNDPTYSHCGAGDLQCPMSYALRTIASSNVYVYGAGMYNFFSNYDNTCLDTESCQSALVDIENSNGLYFFNINTKAAVNIVVLDNTQVLAKSSDNSNNFCQTVNAIYL